MSYSNRPDNHRPRGSQRRTGYALLIVLIVILTTMGLAAVHQRQLSAALRVEQARIATPRRYANEERARLPGCRPMPALRDSRIDVGFFMVRSP